jgi:hypothetical protein
MKSVYLSIHGIPIDFETCRNLALALARKANPDSSLMAWYDGQSKQHSPSLVKCDGDDAPGWEEYGKNHGGTLRMSFNNGGYVFICT